jgi:HSP20 family protein
MAKKEERKEEKDENYTRKEFSFNSFEKSLQLPETVINEKIKARYENGILKFSIAKKEEAKKQKPKMIEIL